MKILYFDAFNGAAGDMILGAFLDAGLPLAALKDALGSLGLRDYEVSAGQVLRAGVTATKFQLLERSPAAVAPGAERAHEHRHEHEHAHGHGQEHAHGHDHGGESGPRDAPRSHSGGHAHRSLKEIHHLIEHSSLAAAGKARARAMFDRLAEAEAAIHGMPVEQVHLHEVGALDSIIDVVGAVFAFEWAAADRVIVSPLNVGGGTVRSAHGQFPVPAPATVRLLGDAPVYSAGPRMELLTPTGALVLTGYASGFGPMPPMRVQQAGYGAGDRDFADTPNVLRLLVGESDESASAERIVVLECEIDDMNPQLFGPLMDRLYAGGALDVFYAPVQMKKNRPGTLVTVLAPPARRDQLVAIVFRETTTIGVRYSEVQRERLDREFVQVETPLGPVRFKVARRGGAIVNGAPEFDDCVRIAGERHMPVKDVQALALKAWLETRPR